MKTLRENLENMMARILEGRGFCPQCGVTSVDEDGCCPECGADASGRYLDELATNVQDLCAYVAKLEANNAQLLCDREVADGYAGRLAAAIAEHFRADIGEHSDTNNPWANALELIDGTFCR